MKMREGNFDAPLPNLVVNIAIAIAVGGFLYYKYDELKTPKYKEIFGMAYRDVSVYGRYRKTVLHFPIYFLKRAVLLLIPVLTGTRVGIQIVFLLNTVIFGVIMYGALRAHETQ